MLVALPEIILILTPRQLVLPSPTLPSTRQSWSANSTESWEPENAGPMMLIGGQLLPQSPRGRAEANALRSSHACRRALRRAGL